MIMSRKSKELYAGVKKEYSFYTAGTPSWAMNFFLVLC